MKSFTVTSLIFALFSLIVTTTATPVGKLNTNENEDWIKNEDDDLLDADILQKLASTKRYSTADIRVSYSLPSTILNSDDLSTDDSAASLTSNFLRLLSSLSQNHKDEDLATRELKDLSAIQTEDGYFLKYPFFDSVLMPGKFKSLPIKTASGSSEMKKRMESRIIGKTRKLSKQDVNTIMNNFWKHLP